MTRTKNTCLVLVAVLLSPMAANAVPITRLITGTDVSGSFTYEDSTAVSGVGITTGFVEYDITAFNFEYDNGTTDESWILSDLVSVNVGSFAVAVDNVGTWLFTGMDVTLPNWGQATFTNSGGSTLRTYSGLIFDPVWRWNDNSAGISVEIMDSSNNRGLGRYTTTTTVPEPGTLALFGIGLAGMGLTRRRKKI